MKAANQPIFEKLEKGIQGNGKLTLGFFGFLWLIDGFGDLTNEKYFFLNFSGAFVLTALLIWFIGSARLQSKGVKLKHAQTVFAYQFVCLLMSGVIYLHYFLFYN